MPSRRTEQEVSDIMRNVRCRDTSPELTLRKALWACGLRYRLHVRSLPGKPDLVFGKVRLAVFVDGDFWHGNQWRKRGHASLEAQFAGSPKADYWVPKIDRNMRRDKRITAELLTNGWRVLRLWESDLKSHPNQCIETVVRSLERGVDPSPVSRLPHQTAAVFGVELADIAEGLHAAGWGVQLTRDYSCQCTIADLPTDAVSNVSLLVVSVPDTELSEVRSDFLDSLLGSVRRMDNARPPIALFRMNTAAIGSPPSPLLRTLAESLTGFGYCCDMFLINEGSLILVGLLVPTESDEPSISMVRPRPVIDFVRNNPGIEWALHTLPTPPLFDHTTGRATTSIFEWIADRYLNPHVTAAIHDKPLSL
jgi:DNA mismatch endonuclease (patch repair protein)